MRLQNKVAIVTGSSRGIGRAVAEGLAREGARVVLSGRDASTLQPVEKQMQDAGLQAISVASDLSDPRAVDQLVGQARQKFGPIDILVNNAGILTPRAPIHEISIEDWDR